MSKLSIFGYAVTAIIGLAVMCLCSLVFSPAWSGFVSYLVFICFGAVIAANILKQSDSRRAKITALCILIGLVGIALVQLCSLLIVPPFSGIAGFLVFVLFAAIIGTIIVKQKKYFDAEYQDLLTDRCMRDAACRLVRALHKRGMADAEILQIIKDKFHYNDQEAAEMMNTAK